jgi:isocitrate dehydrogenase kinase/phosphatase
MQSSDVLVIQPKSPPAIDPYEIARMILAGFDRHYALFRYSAQRAKSHFESGDWVGIQTLSRERIEYYDRRVRECISKLQAALTNQGAPIGAAMTEQQKVFWQTVRQAYVGLLIGHQQPECAETFYNSVTTRALHRDYFHNDFLFVRPVVTTDYLDSERPVYRVYYPLAQGLQPALTRLFADFGLACGFADLPKDVRLLAKAGCQEIARRTDRAAGSRLASDCQIHVLGNLFYRNTKAFVLGRLVNQSTIHPFVIPITRNVAGQLELDALLMDEAVISSLFSFTRAYFLVDMEVPAAYVNFMGTLLPRKPKAEIYTMVGLQKQGKTLFYRDFLQHLAHSHDQFDLAPGIAGLVMCVFTLPSYPYVFKLIKDKIAKDGMTAETVRAKYQLVKLHDRIGRMADTWEYSQVALPRKRFSPALIDQLTKVAYNQVEQDGEFLIFKHLYIERRMVPLNLYLTNARASMRRQAVEDYGNAIKELASANIFPGDMLYKNFGVTRLGRVVFYDYDEIQPMTEMNFRKIPDAPNEEAEMASEPWYAIAPNDVFPEEFATFLLGNSEIREVFVQKHADLLTPQWWQACRDSVVRHIVVDPAPYASHYQLRHHAK